MRFRTPRLFLPLLAATTLVAAPVSAQNGPQSEAQIRADIFVSALQAIERFHQDQFTDTLLWDAAIAGLIEALDDPYAGVFTPEEVEQQDEDNTGNYAGIGVTISQLNDVVTVTAVNRGFPADRAGMQEGDVIVEVDGTDARSWDTEEVSNNIRGEVGTLVTVGVEREGYQGIVYFPITRAQVHTKVVDAGRLDGDILYVVMDRFARNVTGELDSILRVNQDAEGIVLDLRRNPGGFLDEALQMADLFIEPGLPLASTVGRDPNAVGAYRTIEEGYDAQVPARLPDVPMVVLVDEFSASASEILAGALQDYDRALVVGERTFGKGLVQTVLNLPHGRRIRLTSGTWHTPLGRSLHRPRDASGRPLAENPDTFPTLPSASGRELVAAGGIFPDLRILNDTTTLREREFLQFTTTNQIPLPLRVAEFGFEQAQELRAENAAPTLRQDAFQAFLERLEAEGVSPDFLQDEEIRSYIAWQAEISIADRLELLGAATEARMRRDPALTQAVELLRSAATQPALFAAAGEIRSAMERAEGMSEPEVAPGG